MRLSLLVTVVASFRATVELPQLSGETMNHSSLMASHTKSLVVKWTPILLTCIYFTPPSGTSNTPEPTPLRSTRGPDWCAYKGDLFRF
jgi:hypothetical protein